MIKALRFLLFPFSVLYDVITTVRNSLYDQGLKPAATFEIPIIVVGNLSAGGTGKSPMIEHLIRLLRPRYRMSTLSRGYGRSTRGFKVATVNDSAGTIGDEPYQFYKKFRNDIVVAVGEERALAIPYILDHQPEVDVILMDDGFQHRKVKASFQVLLTDYQNLFYEDFLLPSGNLRESRKNARRADVIVVTKCPVEISADRMIEIERCIRKYSNRPVFFTGLHYGELLPVYEPMNPTEKVVLVSGISNHTPIEEHVKHNYSLVKHFIFNDHHQYSLKDIEGICDFAKKHAATIITTEKDAVKFDSPHFRIFFSNIPSFYLPIEIEFLKNGKDFDEMIVNACKRAAS